MNKVIEIYSLNRMCRAVVGGYPPGRVSMYQITSHDGTRLGMVADPAIVAKITDADVHLIRTPEGDRYVAMEPGLRKILEAPFEARAWEAEARARDTRQEAERAIARESEIRWQMFSMPWWRRILFVLRRSNLVR